MWPACLGTSKGQSMTFSEYRREIQKAFARGNATEHTYRPALKALVEALQAGVTATNEPKREACGAPDFIVTCGSAPQGYIEAKDIGRSLDEAERSEQLARYLDGLSNLILTDYLEFRWFVAGEHRMTARLATVTADDKLRPRKDGEEEVLELLNQFLTVDVPTVADSRALAERMAALARLIRDTISLAFEKEGKSGKFHQDIDAFREVLIHDLTPDQFADMYAQTVCYGLFAARCNFDGPPPFTRQHAPYDLPRTNPFLRKMFTRIAGPDLDESITWAVDDLAHLLDKADMAGILEEFGARTRREDPVVHFYETFLAAYDPKMREARGVYYTPEPVVSYIVRSVDHILKEDFGLTDGLADASKVKVGIPGQEKDAEVHKVLILDPACGTGTFLYHVIKEIRERFAGNEGMWSGYVREHLLPRLFGFELLMAPYAVAHMKVGMLLKETGYDFASDERLGVFLPNSLEASKVEAHMPGAQWLAEEANAASDIKRDVPVMVVLGNPPYSGHSANVGEWIHELLRGKDTSTGQDTGNYFEVDGKPLGERNPKWLNDDYVKFIRFAQWRIEQTGYGVLAFITNHGYLDNPTFRGMRQSLMSSFDDIYLLDLHGNARKKEVCPDGSADENVFDITQGVAVAGLVKRKNGGWKSLNAVRHADLWGLRKHKYERLAEDDVSTAEWEQLNPQPPFYLFVPQDIELLGEYERGWKMTDAMPLNGVGMTTARDGMVIDLEAEPLLQRAKTFRDSTESNAELCRELGIPMKKGWNVTSARQLLRQEKDLATFVKPVLYRPFDERLIFYHDSVVWRTVRRVMRHMLAGPNVAALVPRQLAGDFRHVFCTSVMASFNAIGTAGRYGSGYLFPLYLYPDASKNDLLASEEATEAPGGRRPNLAPEFVEEFGGKLGMEFVSDGKGDRKKTFGPEDVFDYTYAVFHSPTYRERYAEFLKIAFPRIPLTSQPGLFRALCALGEELVALHLMEAYGPGITTYPLTGDDVVEKGYPKYRPESGRVHVNREQYFEGVPPAVWEFHVGGYQVCSKWLKDRRGRKLSYDDLPHYQRIVSALAETIRFMSDIDEAILNWPIE